MDKQEFLAALTANASMGRINKVLNKEEIQNFIDTHGSVNVWHEVRRDDKPEVLFCTSIYTFGNGLMPENFVPSSTSLPCNVVARDSLPTGIINNFDDYCAIHAENALVLYSAQDLVDYLYVNYR